MRLKFVLKGTLDGSKDFEHVAGPAQAKDNDDACFHFKTLVKMPWDRLGPKRPIIIRKIEGYSLSGTLVAEQRCYVEVYENDSLNIDFKVTIRA